MYRVELKGTLGSFSEALTPSVPNVPCGVESSPSPNHCPSPAPVPNVPCGVESTSLQRAANEKFGFLMYRVELKGSIPPSFIR